MNTFLPTKRRTSSSKKTFSASFLRMAYGSIFALLLLMSGGVFGQTTVTYSFSASGAVSGFNGDISLDANISFGSFLNNSGTNPTINSGQLRLYQNSTKGGSIKITAKNGVTITKVVMNVPTTGDGKGPRGYSVDSTTETGTFAQGTNPNTMNVSATSYVEYYSKGTSNTTRTYVNSFTVTYTIPVTGSTVTFDKNAADATGTMNNQTASSTVNLTSNGFTREGYTFAGWATSALGSVVYANNAPYPFTASGSATLYAQWTANNNTITFDKNAVDATGSMVNQTLATAATANLTTNSYVRAGYTFQGWATTSGGSVSFTDGASYTMGTTNATLFAKWLTDSPFINPTGTLVALSSIYGTASTTTTFSFTSANLTDNVTVTAPSGFEVSTAAGSGYASFITVVPTGGAIAATTIYVRLAAATVPGNYSGNVVLTSSGATTKNVATVSSTVAAKNLTITGLTGVNKTYDGTTTATTSGTAALLGIVGSDDVTLSGTPVLNFNNANAGTSKAITVTGYTLAGSALSRYTLSQPTGLTGNITAKALSISGASVASKVYNGSSATGTVTAGTLSGLVGTQTVTVTPTGTYANANAGTGKIGTISYILGNGTNGGLAANYTLANDAAIGTITKALLTATADDKSKATGAANPTLTITYSGFVNGETTGTASGFSAPTISTTAVTLSPAGTYPIILTGGAADNYALTLVAGTLTVKDIYGGIGTFEKITTVGELTDGYYVMAYLDEYAMNSTHNGTYLDRTAISVTGGKVVNPPASIVWKIETNGAGRTIYNEGTEKYVSYTGGSNNVQVVDAVSADNQRWTPSIISGDFGFTNNAVTARRLQYNAGASRFACYTGTQQDFTLYKFTVQCTEPTVTLQATPVTSIATTTASLNGNVTAQGDFAINTRGFEYSVNSNMTASATSSTATTATETYSENLTGLVANTVYYYRGYAVNDCTPNKTGYTATSTFTTLPNAPTVGIGAAATPSSFTANWTAPTGGAALFTYEIQVDDDNTFASVDFTTSGLSGTSVSASGLSASTTYFYRVRAVNAGGNSAWSAVSAGIATLAPAPEINIKQGVTSIASAGTFAHGNQITTTSGSAVTFTIENTGEAALSVGALSKSGTDAGQFTITQPLSSSVAAGGTTTFTVVFSPTSLGAKSAQLSLVNGDANENPYIINLTGTGTASATSDIISDATFTYATNIDYKNHITADITAVNSVELGRFTIRDGGVTTDADDLGTVLSALSFTVGNSANLQKLAIYDGTTEVAEVVATGTTNFTGLTLTAADNGIKTFTIRGSFKTAVTDNQRIQLTVASATASATGSGFGAISATTSTTVNDNVIEVTANGLGFTTQPTSTAINVAMATVVVAATDSNANVDLDFTGPVSIFSTGTLTGSPVAGNLVAGVASFTTLTHTVAETGRMLFASASGLITGGSSLFDITEIVYVTGDYRTIGTGNWLSNNASPAIWQRLDAAGNWNPSNSPSYNTTNNVYIRDTHTITATGSFGNGVKLKIMDGGTFDMTSSGTVSSIYVYNGGELRVNGALTVVGAFDVENGADVYINAPSATIWGGTENFRPLSNFYIWNWNSAQYLYNNNINPNSSGSIFGNLYIDTLGASGISDTWNLLGPNTGTIALTSGDLAFNSGQNNIRFFAETGSTANVTVKGNLKLNSGWTSGRTLALSTAGTMNLTVEGNVEIDCPGDLAIKQSSAPASAATLNINGDLVMNGSNTTASTNLHLNFANSGSGGGGKAIVNLKGNLLSNSNASITNSVSTADVEFNFNGITTQLVNMGAAISGSETDNTRGVPLYVKPNAIVQLNSNDLILANGSSLTVETGGTLDFGFNGSTALIIKQGQTGNSAFTSQTESNLKITSPAGIASSGATGNVQTSSRTFGAADYRYVGLSNQYTGTGLPTTGAKITSANIGTAPTNEVLLTNSPTSVTALDVVSGKFNLNEKTLTGTNLSIANDATLKIVGTATFPTFTPRTFATNSIVEYGGANQVIAALTAPTYAKLKVSGTGIKTLASADIQVDNSLQVTGCLLKIEEGKTLSVTNEITTVNTNVVPKTDNNVYVAPTLGITIDDGGSLVQTAVVNNQSGNLNTGKINMERLTQKMYRLDYTYWSSPVGDGFTLHDLSPNTLASKYFQWNPGPVPAGNWGVISGGNSAMVPGKGYIIRAPNSYAIDASNPGSYQKFTGNFIGKPNNGTISIPVSGSDTVNVWNLLGNPYPSALDADLFLDANIGISDPGINNTLGGTLYFWTHNTPFASTTTFNYSASDYASWNRVGGTNTAAAASTPNGNANLGAPNGKIAAGQAFFIKGTANGSAVFNNDMRVKGENMQFFRPTADNNSNYALTTGKHRIWLNLQGATQGFSQTLVGYVTNATNDYDIRYDGESFGGNAVTFYSVNNDKNLVIQGRALPFVDTDEVPMGYKTTLTGNLTISIDHKDGLFDNQLVYLKDNVLNVVHNLSASAYTFAAVPGTFNDRFVLRYLPAEDLANPTFEDEINGVTIRKNDTTIRVNSPYETIDEVLIYDIMGRLIFEKKECNSTTFETNTLTNSDQVLIVKVKLNNGGVVTKKVF